MVTHQWATWETAQGKYSGYIVEKSTPVPEGYGHMSYSNKDQYTGQWSNGVRNGYGYFVFNSVSDYFGWWENGVMMGPGILRSCSNSDMYIGWFHNNKRNGRGLYMKNIGYSLVHDGQWVNNQKHGEGKVFRNGSLIFEGNFENNICSGIGIKRIRSGNISVCFYLSGVEFGDGIEWSPCMNFAHRMDGTEIKQKISAEEARRSSNELFLPIPSSDFINDYNSKSRHDIYSHIFERIKGINIDALKSVDDLSILRDMLAEIFSIMGMGQLDHYCLRSNLYYYDEKDIIVDRPPLDVEIKKKEKPKKDEQNDSVSSISASEASEMSLCSNAEVDLQSLSSSGK